MNNLADIRRRIASVKQTRQITGAMETISVAKMRKSFELLENNGAYSSLLLRAAAYIASGDEEMESLIAPPTSGVDLFIIISSDKGLCGGYNHDIFKLADKMTDGDTAIIPIGQTAYERYGKRRDVNADFVSFISAPDYKNAKSIANAVLDRYGKDVKSVTAIFGEVEKGGAFKPTYRRILPLDVKTERDGSRPMLEPSAQELYKEALPLYLSGMIYGAFVSSAAAEHGARRAAMAASKKSADEMIQMLSTEYNRARQGSVTAQITEIIGSTQAFGQGDIK